MTTIESILADISSCGWFVNNLFQLRDGTWQCNLRRGYIGTSTYITAFAQATTASAALEEAFHNLSTAVEVVAEPTCWDGAMSPTSTSADIDTILKGLIRPSTQRMVRKV